MKISMIGFGNIAKAIAQGLLSNKDNQLWASSPSLSMGVNLDGIHTHHDNLAVIVGADIIILAVKPAKMSDVFTQIKDAIPPHCLIISVASGLSLPWFEKQSSRELAIVRAMPNIAAAIGQSATPLVANRFANAQQKQIAEEIFSTIGIITWLQDEEDIDRLTALSGSGPAYVFQFMEAMISAAIKLGLSEEIAKSFALQTVQGALSLATKSSLSLPELRQQVTSPAGTTAAALDVFAKRKLNSIILEAMKAAHDRAQELGLIRG